ncbi:aldehyde dehydrogenase family protein [Rhizobium lusitanum]|uniref:Aldehyde dehydrogenase family protein n=1 Tax=Rhizobium lusitanum TaxID=293958 RepID=A0A6L9UHZ3_9HYPH|nr:NAD-dependent succinate-semialdehyde dehydrogenase [Rhizobium lusitanum]NEI74002.1 aldehyde dehydrogenase family protein [Rhizobium lusitanum]
MYPDTELFIAGEWTNGTSGVTLPILNPATGGEIGRVAKAGKAEMDRALVAAERAFRQWRKTTARERAKLLHAAADNLKARLEDIAPILTMEQGKPLAEARSELRNADDVIRWFAEEGIRSYGRLIPARRGGVQQMVMKEPIGVVAAFTPWNYPVAQAIRKISAALASGCTVILKAAEEAPASCAAMVRAFADAGFPDGAINLLYGIPAEISEYLIPHPAIRKVSFTGSTSVGKRLASLAGAHMKRVTMELGGHAPYIVCADADLPKAVSMLAEHKFHNAGQVCIAPTRVLVEEPVYDRVLEDFVTAVKAIRIGDGFTGGVDMGPMANARRLDAMDRLIGDAVARGGRLLTGGNRIGNAGFFFEPTVLAEVPKEAAIMNEEPFGPVAVVNRFSSIDEAIDEANRLPVGLAAYAFTRTQRNAQRFADDIEAGMLSINDYGLAYAEVPFNGIKDSGYGSEGGAEALETFQTIKFVSQTNF